MDDGFGLGLVKPQKERPSGASELFIGKIGGGLFSAGPPDTTHHAGKLTEHLFPVDFVLNFPFPGGQVVGLGRKTFGGSFIRVKKSDRLLVEIQYCKKIR